MDSKKAIILGILLAAFLVATGAIVAAQSSSASQSGHSMVRTYNSDDSGAGKLVFYTVKPGSYSQINYGDAFIPGRAIIYPRLPVNAQRYTNRRPRNRPITPIPVAPITEWIAFETVSKGYYGGFNERKNHVIANNNDWANLWDNVCSTRIPKPALPGIDFNRNMIIAVCQGWRSTGGYSIEVIKITENENTLEVFVKEVSPGPRCMLTQAVTCPFHIIKVPKMDKEVKFTVNQEIRSCQ